MYLYRYRKDILYSATLYHSAWRLCSDTFGAECRTLSGSAPRFWFFCSKSENGAFLVVDLFYANTRVKLTEIPYGKPKKMNIRNFLTNFVIQQYFK